MHIIYNYYMHIQNLRSFINNFLYGSFPPNNNKNRKILRI